uniref:AAA-ATPase n=1 Tax=Hordeum vulgare subsp. vulgare TaxID=112509 RepID=A0A8I7BJE0_HORVV
MYLAPVAFGVARSLYKHLRRRLGRHVPSVDPFVTVDVVARPGDPHPYHSSYHDVEARSSDAYAEVLAYLSAACSREARKLRAEGHGFVLGLRDGQEVADEFKGVTVWWSAVPPSPADGRRCCRLTFHESHRRLVVDDTPLSAATSSTRRHPPGTRKSSMIAAMANYLNYDVYDVELASLQTNSDLRRLFAGTTRRSIIVIENVDRSLDNPQRDDGVVTLPGLLDLIDGLWSAHGGERMSWSPPTSPARSTRR